MRGGQRRQTCADQSAATPQRQRDGEEFARRFGGKRDFFFCWIFNFFLFLTPASRGRITSLHPKDPDQKKRKGFHSSERTEAFVRLFVINQYSQDIDLFSIRGPTRCCSNLYFCRDLKEKEGCCFCFFLPFCVCLASAATDMPSRGGRFGACAGKLAGRPLWMWVVMLCTLLAGSAGACPALCTCSGTTVDCHGLGLRSMPRNIPRNTERL